jgi:hypothetical protein
LRPFLVMASRVARMVVPGGTQRFWGMLVMGA